MGSKRKPREIKELQGTNRADRSAKNEMVSSVSELPVPPGHLNENAVLVWNEYGNKLLKVGVLKETDLEMFAAYCCEVADYRSAVKQLESDGNYIKEKYSDGTVKAIRRHPAITVRNNAFKNMKSIASEFGLTPHSSQLIPMKKQEKDPLTEHLNKRPKK